MSLKTVPTHTPVDQHATTIQWFRQRLQTLQHSAAMEHHAPALLHQVLAELAALIDLLAAHGNAHQRTRDQWQRERAQMAAAVADAQEAFMRAPLPYLVTSLDGVIRRANVAACTLLGTSEERLIGQSLAVVVPEEQRALFHTRVHAMLDTRTMQTWPLTVCPVSGPALALLAAVLVVRRKTGIPQSLYWQLYAFRSIRGDTGFLNTE